MVVVEAVAAAAAVGHRCAERGSEDVWLAFHPFLPDVFDGQVLLDMSRRDLCRLGPVFLLELGREERLVPGHHRRIFVGG